MIAALIAEVQTCSLWRPWAYRQMLKEKHEGKLLPTVCVLSNQEEVTDYKNSSMTLTWELLFGLHDSMFGFGRINTASSNTLSRGNRDVCTYALSCIL